MPLAKEKERYTYQDYLTWPEGERWELIDGMAYDMSPAPDTEHQSIAGHLFLILGIALRGKPCVPLFSPIDVVLSDLDVVQPDMIVICDKSKITKRNIQGAPDLVIEVLSPSTSLKDRREKKRLYEKSGVKEYILIDPEGRYIERFILGEDGLFNRGEIFGSQEVLSLKSLTGIEIPLWEVFGEEKKVEGRTIE